MRLIETYMKSYFVLAVTPSLRLRTVLSDPFFEHCLDTLRLQANDSSLCSLLKSKLSDIVQVLQAYDKALQNGNITIRDCELLLFQEDKFLRLGGAFVTASKDVFAARKTDLSTVQQRQLCFSSLLRIATNWQVLNTAPIQEQLAKADLHWSDLNLKDFKSQTYYSFASKVYQLISSNVIQSLSQLPRLESCELFHKIVGQNISPG